MKFSLNWMAWTWQTAAFFAIIAVLIIIMTVMAFKKPELPRRGIFFIETTRGDRLFLSLLGSAFILLAWLGCYGTPLLGGLIIALLYTAIVFCFV